MTTPSSLSANLTGRLGKPVATIVACFGLIFAAMPVVVSPTVAAPSTACEGTWSGNRGGLVLNAGDQLTFYSNTGYVRYAYNTGGMYSYQYGPSPQTVTITTAGTYSAAFYPVTAANTIDYTGNVGLNCDPSAPPPPPPSPTPEAPTNNVPQIQQDVRGFVDSRQSVLFSSIATPNLTQRRAQQAGSIGSGSVSPSESGVLLSYSGNVNLGEAASQASSLAAAPASDASRFNAWIKATAAVHQNGASDDRLGTFGLLSFGADYLVTDEVLIGLSLHIDTVTDPRGADTDLEGKGWLAGPYASIELFENVFWDSSVLIGGSHSSIDTATFDGSFDSFRLLLDTSLNGEWHLDDATRIIPTLRAIYSRENVEQYVVTNSAGTAVIVDGFAAEQFRVSVGGTIEHDIDLGNGLQLTPSLGAHAGLASISNEGAFGSVKAGLDLSADMWSIQAATTGTVDAYGHRALSGTLGLIGKF